MKIGEVVRDYRTKNKLSQRQFAQKCRLSNGYISMLEEGKNPKTNEPIVPTFESYKKIAYGMGLSVDMLFALMDDAPIIVNKSPSTAHDEGEEKLLELYRRASPETRKLVTSILEEIESYPEESKKMILGMLRGAFEIQ